MPIPRQEQQRVMPDYSPSSNTTPNYGASASQGFQYPPTGESGHTTATNTSMNTAPSGQQQYGYSPLYPTYEKSGNSGSKDISNRRR
jgi:hypothetical protein